MLLTVLVPPASLAPAILFLPLLSEHESILDATAALQDVWVVGVVVAFADDICGAELELFGERGGACPLDRVVVVVRARVLAAHHVDLVKTTRGAANAVEL